ncbi:MAG: DUF4388 domain-containing protein [bacterium]|nr:DUF4388 domain-containing protein [bacterium]
MQSIHEIGRRLCAEHYSGTVTCTGADRELHLWFVRGEIVHAAAKDGAIGWEALAGVKNLQLEVAALESGVLPPERSIRVATDRLLEALSHSGAVGSRNGVHVPLPFHARLQNKFAEIQRRVKGLRALEAHESLTSADHPAPAANDAGQDQSVGDRVIIEVSPRGAQWQHQSHGQELKISADGSVSTSDLMWAGEEMRREFNRLNKEMPPNE